MKNKLENLLSFNDFRSNWNYDKQIKTKRTETGLDILKESVEYNTLEDKIKKIENLLFDYNDDDDLIEDIVNKLRDSFTKMEKNGDVSQYEIDDLDNKHGGDWKSWILEIIKSVPDNTLNKLLIMLGENVELNDESDDEDDEDDEDEDDEDVDGYDDENNDDDYENEEFDK